MIKPVFSILMCARNAEETIEKTISSVCKQTISEWELIILDNGSTDETWNIIKKYSDMDNRISGYHLDCGIGWARGASLCLSKAKGKYMTFLAADDFLSEGNSLYYVKEEIEKENPDIVMIGYRTTIYNNNKYEDVNIMKPQYKIYSNSEDKMLELSEIMMNTYYNSFFHFENIDFLKKNNINFYLPYYADYEGMTEALLKADKIVVLDKDIYSLSYNTSQTRGASVVRKNIQQWNRVVESLITKGKYNRNVLQYISSRIFNNNIAILQNICDGARTRDLEMNDIKMTSIDRFIFLEKQLELKEWNMMLYYSNNIKFQNDIENCIVKAYENCIKDGYSIDEVKNSSNWLYYIVESQYDVKNNEVVVKDKFDNMDFINILQAMNCPLNSFAYGFEYLDRMIDSVTIENKEIITDILKNYALGRVNIVKELLFIANRISEKRKTEEVSIIRSECEEILQSIKNYANINIMDEYM